MLVFVVIVFFFVQISVWLWSYKNKSGKSPLVLLFDILTWDLSRKKVYIM